MRTGRITLEGHSYYHVMSRLVAGTPRMEAAQKEQLRRLMRAYETFCGLHVLTYALMGTHFHILLEVPERQEVDEAEIVRRMRAIYSARQIRERLAQWALWREQGHEALVQAELGRLRARMYDLSQYMKTLKQRYTQWYNRTSARRGTLWEDRFKSLVVEGSENALTTLATYIDLNPMRGGLVRDPKTYRWSGYAEALGGSPQARAGLLRLLRPWLGEAAGWDTAQRAYRLHLYDRGAARGRDEAGRPLRPGLSPEAVEQVVREGGRLSRAKLLHCRVRYFSDGVALGSREFVNDVFRRNRAHFGPKRLEGARALRYGDWGGLYGARDLRRAPISAAAASG